MDLVNRDYPKTPEFGAKFGPRGVLKCKATATDNPAPADPRFGAWGKQTCEDTGPLTTKRMETADEEFLAATVDAMDRAVKAGEPFFIWHNTTRMHIWTHLQQKYQDMIPENGFYGAGMTELDDNIGVLLKKLQDLGIADNTIVIFSSDNGARPLVLLDAGLACGCHERRYPILVCSDVIDDRSRHRTGPTDHERYTVAAFPTRILLAPEWSGATVRPTFWLFLGVQVIEISVELIEAVHSGKKFIAIA